MLICSDIIRCITFENFDELRNWADTLISHIICERYFATVCHAPKSSRLHLYVPHGLKESSSFFRHSLWRRSLGVSGNKARGLAALTASGEGCLIATQERIYFVTLSDCRQPKMLASWNFILGEVCVYGTGYICLSPSPNASLLLTPEQRVFYLISHTNHSSPPGRYLFTCHLALQLVQFIQRATGPAHHLREWRRMTSITSQLGAGHSNDRSNCQESGGYSFDLLPQDRQLEPDRATQELCNPVPVRSSFQPQRREESRHTPPFDADSPCSIFANDCMALQDRAKSPVDGDLNDALLQDKTMSNCSPPQQGVRGELDAGCCIHPRSSGLPPVRTVSFTCRTHLCPSTPLHSYVNVSTSGQDEHSCQAKFQPSPHHLMHSHSSHLLKQLEPQPCPEPTNLPPISTPKTDAAGDHSCSHHTALLWSVALPRAPHPQKDDCLIGSVNALERSPDQVNHFHTVLRRCSFCHSEPQLVELSPIPVNNVLQQPFDLMSRPYFFSSASNPCSPPLFTKSRKPSNQRCSRAVTFSNSAPDGQYVASSRLNRSSHFTSTASFLGSCFCLNFQASSSVPESQQKAVPSGDRLKEQIWNHTESPPASRLSTKDANIQSSSRLNFGLFPKFSWQHNHSIFALLRTKQYRRRDWRPRRGKQNDLCNLEKGIYRLLNHKSSAELSSFEGMGLPWQEVVPQNKPRSGCMYIPRDEIKEALKSLQTSPHDSALSITSTGHHRGPDHYFPQAQLQPASSLLPNPRSDGTNRAHLNWPRPLPRLDSGSPVCRQSDNRLSECLSSEGTNSYINWGPGNVTRRFSVPGVTPQTVSCFHHPDSHFHSYIHLSDCISEVANINQIASSSCARLPDGLHDRTNSTLPLRGQQHRTNPHDCTHGSAISSALSNLSSSGTSPSRITSSRFGLTSRLQDVPGSIIRPPSKYAPQPPENVSPLIENAAGTSFAEEPKRQSLNYLNLALSSSVLLALATQQEVNGVLGSDAIVMANYVLVDLFQPHTIFNAHRETAAFRDIHTTRSGVRGGHRVSDLSTLQSTAPPHSSDRSRISDPLMSSEVSILSLNANMVRTRRTVSFSYKSSENLTSSSIGQPSTEILHGSSASWLDEKFGSNSEGNIRFQLRGSRPIV